MPDSIANDVRALLADIEQAPGAFAAAPRWLFPGLPRSRPIAELSLSHRLKRLGFEARDARQSALLDLAGEIPAATLADLIGVSVTTATNWAEVAGRPWGDYPTLRALPLADSAS
jgi:hypothetical protein